MSNSTDSTNSGEFSPDDYEMNYDELTIVKEETVVKTNSESFTDRLKLKELSEKFAKMELKLKITKLELKNAKLDKKEEQLDKKEEQLEKKEDQLEKKEDQLEKKEEQLDKKEEQLDKKEEQLEKKEEKLDKKEEQLEKKEEKLDKKEEQLVKKEQKLEKNFEELQKKLVEIEHQQNEQQKSIEQQKALQEELEKKLMEQIVTLEAKISKTEMENQQQKVSIDKIEHLQNNALEKEQKEKQMEMALLNFQQNCWDVNTCHNDLQITDLMVHCYKGKKNEIRTVFATHPILFAKDFPNIFYFEISIKNMQHSPSDLLFFAFTTNEQKRFGETHTYAYCNHGQFIINGVWKCQQVDSYIENDIVGCGINSATRQIFFTKNGQCRGPFDFVDNSSYYVTEPLFPFVLLFNSGEKIEANFGPNFKFNLATL
ncbi:hypothetical protein niasHS_015681 [Heterodera schachtii]|uniref:B30.2/SPRY domain-containing protein n=1 Tax=Heterodera schachtii TaxID=97005 RepID=A0ABD2HVG8_HETSC